MHTRCLRTDESQDNQINVIAKLLNWFYPALLNFIFALYGYNKIANIKIKSWHDSWPASLDTSTYMSTYMYTNEYIIYVYFYVISWIRYKSSFPRCHPWFNLVCIMSGLYSCWQIFILKETMNINNSFTRRDVGGTIPRYYIVCVKNKLAGTIKSLNCDSVRAFSTGPVPELLRRPCSVISSVGASRRPQLCTSPCFSCVEFDKHQRRSVLVDVSACTARLRLLLFYSCAQLNIYARLLWNVTLSL